MNDLVERLRNAIPYIPSPVHRNTIKDAIEALRTPSVSNEPAPSTYQSAKDCPLGQMHGFASTYKDKDSGKTCCDFCGFPVEQEPAPSASVSNRTDVERAKAAILKVGIGGGSTFNAEDRDEMAQEWAEAVIASLAPSKDEGTAE